jgi:RimJ/RimL family protein N-acetyltransferase
MLKLVDVYTEIAETRPATKFLYELLKEREPHQNISHCEMPSYEEHIRFVDSHPYREWYMIFHGDIVIGAIYLSKQNEIGIFIKKIRQGEGYGKQAVRLLMEMHLGERFLANINPHNSRSIDMFESLGFELKQLTFAKTTCASQKMGRK